MFFRFIIEKDNKDKYGRTSEDAWEEHALWCLRTVCENKPDTQEQIDYMMNNSPTYLACPPEFREYLAGDAVFNAFADLKKNFEKFKEHYTEEEIQFVKRIFKFP